MTGRWTRLEMLAPWLAGAALACPVLAAYYPPMSDLPYHEAGIGILRYFQDTARFPAGLYELNLGEPNQLFHLVGWALAYFVSTRWAVKVVVAASVLAIPVCAARLARHAGSNPLAGLLVAPMALGWLFSCGLVANLIGLAALLAVLPVLDRLGAEPTPRRVLEALGALVLLYFAHIAMMMAYAAAGLGLMLLYPWSLRKSAYRLVPLLAGLGITLAQTRWQQRYLTAVVAGMPRVWEPLSRKILLVPYLVLPTNDGRVQLVIALLCMLALGTFLGLRTRERRASLPTPVPSAHLEDARAWARVHRWEMFSLAGLAAYLSFPLSLNGAMLVYQRWLPPAFAVLAATSAPRDLGSSAARLPAWLVLTATLLVVVPSFVDSDQQYRLLEKLLAEIEPGSAVAQLAFGPVDRARTYSLAPGSGRALATRGGRLAYSFTDSSIFPVFIPRQYQWEGALSRIGSGDFRPKHDLKMFRYLLAIASDPATAQIATTALVDDARLVDASGGWLLFESRLSVVPPRSSALKMETPAPETLAERARRILAAKGLGSAR